MHTAKQVKATVHCGRCLHNPNLIASPDPYVKIDLGSQTSKSKPNKEGKNPHWNHSAVFQYNKEPSMKFHVFDKDTFTADDPMGHCEINLANVPETGWRGEIKLHRNAGHDAGTIDVEIGWVAGTPRGMGNPGQQGMPQQQMYAQPGMPPQQMYAQQPGMQPVIAQPAYPMQQGMQPVIAQPGMMQPGMQPVIAQPGGMMQPGMMQPGMGMGYPPQHLDGHHGKKNKKKDKKEKKHKKHKKRGGSSSSSSSSSGSGSS